MLDLDPKVILKPSGTHSCRHYCMTFTKDIGAICNPLAGFTLGVQGGKVAFAHRDFVRETDVAIEGPPPAGCITLEH